MNTLCNVLVSTKVRNGISTEKNIANFQQKMITSKNDFVVFLPPDSKQEQKLLVAS